MFILLLFLCQLPCHAHHDIEEAIVMPETDIRTDPQLYAWLELIRECHTCPRLHLFILISTIIIITLFKREGEPVIERDVKECAPGHGGSRGVIPY